MILLKSKQRSLSAKSGVLIGIIEMSYSAAIEIWLINVNEISSFASAFIIYRDYAFTRQAIDPVTIIIYI